MVNLAFNVNIEFLNLCYRNIQIDILDTIRRVLSTIDASNHIHHMALSVEPFRGHYPLVAWDAWEEVYSVLAGPRFQFLRMLRINRGPGYGGPSPKRVVETSQNMVAAHRSLETRGVRVSYCWKTGYQCIFCADNPWYDCPSI
jgi:hypothetical protein